MTVIPISCQSEGALEVYIEPVVPTAAARRGRPLADGPHARRPGRGAGLAAPTSSTAPTSPPTTLDARSRRRGRHPGPRRRGGDRAGGRGAAGVRRAGRLAQARRGRARLPRRPRRAPRAARPGARARRARPRPHLAPRDRGRRSWPSWCSCGPPARSRPVAASERPGRSPRAETAEAIDPVCGMTVTADAGAATRSSTTATRTTSAASAAATGSRRTRAPTSTATRRPAMLLKNDFEVAQPVDKVWGFFEDIPQVAACLPGAELTEDLGDDEYAGTVAVRMGPVKLRVRRHAADRRAGRGRQAAGPRRRRAPTRRAAARPAMHAHRPADRRRAAAPRSTVDQDLQLSGAAAQYGRGMIADVTAVLMGAVRHQHAAAASSAARARRRPPTRSTTGAPPSGFGHRRAGRCSWR